MIWILAAAWAQQLEAAEQPVTAPVVRDRPAVVEPVPTKKICKKAEAVVDGDTFDGKLRLHAEKVGHFYLDWTEGREAVVSWVVPVPGELWTNGEAHQRMRDPGTSQVQVKLADGTQIAMHTTTGSVVPALFGPVFRGKVKIGDEVVLALASSPVAVVRWTFEDVVPRDHERSKGDGLAYQRAFACLAVTQRLIPTD